MSLVMSVFWSIVSVLGNITYSIDGVLLKMFFPSSKKELLLMDAVKQGDTTKVYHAIISGVNIYCMDDLGRTPLIHAAARGYLKMVKMLTERMSNINYKDYYKMSALMYARKNKHWNVVLELSPDEKEERFSGDEGKSERKPLLRKGIVKYVNGVVDPITIQLHKAVYMGDEGEVYNLVVKNRGIDLNGLNYKGNTALHVAINTKNVAMVNFLIRLGADILKSNKDGKTPLDLVRSRSYDNKEIIHAVDKGIGGIGLREIEIYRKGRGNYINFDLDKMKDVVKHGINGVDPIIIQCFPVNSISKFLGL